MRVIVAGSRDFADYNFLRDKLDFLLSRVNEDVTIISGCARGADSLGERYAKERGLTLLRMPADWQKHGKRAGYMRNVEMANAATHCVIFRVNHSKGSSLMQAIAKEFRLCTRIYLPKNPNSFSVGSTSRFFGVIFFRQEPPDFAEKSGVGG